MPLVGAHVAQGETLANSEDVDGELGVVRDEMPVRPLVGVEGERRFPALVVVECSQEAIGAVGHERCGGTMVIVVVMVLRGEGCQSACSQNGGGRSQKRAALHACSSHFSDS